MLIRLFPLKPIYLAFLTVLLYFCIHCFSFLPVGLFILALVFLVFQYDRQICIKTLLFLLPFAAFFFYFHQKRQSEYQIVPRQVQKLIIIPDTLSVNGDNLSFRAKSGHWTYQVFYKLKSETEKHYFEQLWQTAEIQVTADVVEAEEQRNFKGFDYRNYLKMQGIYRIVNVTDIKTIKLSSKRSWFARLHEWRRRALVSIQSKFPDPMKHYMTGLLFGYLDKSFDEMNAIYSSLGIIHLFALSGMQVSFFIGKFRYLGLRLGIRQEYMNAIQLPFSLLYAGLTGFAVSVVRSLIQSNLTHFGFKKQDNFALTLFVMFFLIPNFLLTTGGVLSFAYAFILIMIDFETLSLLKRILFQTFSLSLGILPLLMWYFSSFQPLSILLTIFFSFIFDNLMLPFLTLAYFLSPFVSLACFNPAFRLLERIIVQIHLIFSRPFILGSPTLPILLLLLCLLALLYDFRQKKRVVLVLSSILALLFFISKNPLTNEVTIVDIGQGDSILLRDISSKTILIDVGGKVTFGQTDKWRRRISDTNAEKTLIPYLKSRGIDKIDQLVLTHTDTDHMGDMEVVAKAFHVGEVLVSPGSLTKANFVSKLRRMKVKVHITKPGETLSIMGSHLQVLYPLKIGDGGNNDSIVLYGRLLGLNFLFTGDLEKEGEAELLKTYPNLKVDVLKAGHHGSKGSSSPELLAQIEPKIALISAGKNNRYKHPHQETLDRFAQIKSRIYRTDQEGAIRFKGLKHWQIETVR